MAYDKCSQPQSFFMLFVCFVQKEQNRKIEPYPDRTGISLDWNITRILEVDLELNKWLVYVLGLGL